MKVMLLFPPNWTPTMPHLALPTLTAFLRSHGVEVIQRDLNIEVFDKILTRDYMRQALSRLREMYTAEGTLRPGIRRRGVPKTEVVRWALKEGPKLVAQVETAKNIIRSDAFFDGPIGKQALQTVAQNLEIASLPFYPASLHLQSYEAACAVDSSAALLHGVRDPNHNMFLDIYDNEIINDIEREKPDIVGISIPSMAQMLPGMTIAALIRDRGLDCHITVGGPHISMLREEIAKVPRLFSLIDSAVVFDGELPLLELVRAVVNKKDLASVPNLVYRDAKGVHLTERKEPEKITNLPLPDFDGLQLDRYLAPKLVLPLMTARGCYFGKCAFCNVGYGEAENFSQLKAEHLADQMLTLKEKYGTEHIFFADEAITPRNLRDLPQVLQERNSPVHWSGCLRFEKVINRNLLQKAYDGGMRMILFGLETASEAMIQRMVKGTQIDNMNRILEESAEVGIWNHTFFFFGFPGETLENAQDTVNFVYEHKYHINSAAMGTFLLERYSPAHRFPKTFGIRHIVEPPEKDLAIYFDYEVEAGMDEQMAELVVSRLLDNIPPKQYPQFYVHDVYRFLFASHQSRHGLPMPPWLVPEETLITEQNA